MDGTAPEGAGVVGRNLVADLEENLWATYSKFGQVHGANLIDDANRLVLESPLRQPPYNSVLRFRDDGTRPLVDQVIQLVDRFRSRDVVGAWVIHPTTTPGMRQVLTDLGWTMAEPLQGMAMDLSSLPPLPSVDPEIEVVDPEMQDGTEWLDLISWRYGLDDEDSPYLREVYRTHVAHGSRLWTARVGGVPLSKAVVSMSGDVAGIYGVATKDGGRGRGLASLLTLHALHEARDRGAVVGVLHSTPTARALYARIGFQDVAPFEIWALPDTVHL